jgi:glycerol kinase
MAAGWTAPDQILGGGGGVGARVTDTEGVYMVPAFAGLGAPHWNQYARGSLFGMTRGTNQAHIARAALDSIAYQTYDVLKAMEADSGIVLKSCGWMAALRPTIC